MLLAVLGQGRLKKVYLCMILRSNSCSRKTLSGKVICGNINKATKNSEMSVANWEYMQLWPEERQENKNGIQRMTND